MSDSYREVTAGPSRQQRHYLTSVRMWSWRVLIGRLCETCDALTMAAVLNITAAEVPLFHILQSVPDNGPRTNPAYLISSTATLQTPS